MRKSYPSDITREQFEVIRPILNRATKTTHPRKYDLYDIFCAVLYLIKEGCTWRGIPHDFPKWENVRYHYDIWAKPDENGFSLLDGILRDPVEIERETDNREARTTMLIIDSKTSRNADTAKEKGYDAGKKNRNQVAYGRRYSGIASCHPAHDSQCDGPRRRRPHDFPLLRRNRLSGFIEENHG